MGQCCFLLAAVTKLNVDRYQHYKTILTVSNDSFSKFYEETRDNNEVNGKSIKKINRFNLNILIIRHICRVYYPGLVFNSFNLYYFSCLLYSQIGEVSAKFLKCKENMSACICAICKHFTSVDKKPCLCEKCGICR